MELDDADRAALDRACTSWVKIEDPEGTTNLILSGYPLPDGLSPREADLLIRLPSQFPDVPPDMFWTIPDVRLARSGSFPPAADQRQPLLGRDWQRFSRHLAPGAWRLGIDGLPSWLAAIRTLLVKDAAA